jgi:hypothetical protein
MTMLVAPAVFHGSHEGNCIFLSEQFPRRVADRISADAGLTGVRFPWALARRNFQEMTRIIRLKLKEFSGSTPSNTRHEFPSPSTGEPRLARRGR